MSVFQGKITIVKIILRYWITSVSSDIRICQKASKTPVDVITIYHRHSREIRQRNHLIRHFLQGIFNLHSTIRHGSYNRNIRHNISLKPIIIAKFLWIKLLNNHLNFRFFSLDSLLYGAHHFPPFEQAFFRHFHAHHLKENVSFRLRLFIAKLNIKLLRQNRTDSYFCTSLSSATSYRHKLHIWMNSKKFSH